jgi:hypothetical protein
LCRHSQISLLAGKIQGILPISPVGSSQKVQNIGGITVRYERIPGALEQGNFGSHQGIELGNQVLSGKEHSLALLAFVLKEYELWLVMKALVVNQTQPSGAIFDAANRR